MTNLSFVGDVYQWLHATIHSIPIEVLLSASALIVAVYMPVAIFLNEESSTSIHWDRQVILKYVIGRKAGLALVLLAVPLMLWDAEIGSIRLVSLLIYIVGFAILAYGIYRSWKWIEVDDRTRTLPADGESFRTRLRYKYLDHATPNMRIDIFSRGWSADHENNVAAIGILDERKLIERFVTYMSTGSIQERDQHGTPIVQILELHLDDLSVYDPYIQRLLLFAIFKDGNLFNDRNDEREGVHYPYELDKLFHDILRWVIKNNQIDTTFRLADEYQTSKNVVVDDFRGRVVESLLDVLTSKDAERGIELLETWRIPSIAGKWAAFKFTKSQLRTIDGYFRWVNRRNTLTTGGGIYDFQINHMTDEIFPHIEPIMWSQLVAFEGNSWYGVEGEDNAIVARVRSYIERHRTFGHIGKSIVSSVTDDSDFDTLHIRQMDEANRQEKEIAALMHRFPGLFPSFSSIERIDALIDAAKGLRLKKESIEESRRESFIAMLSRLKNALEEDNEASV